MIIQTKADSVTVWSGDRHGDEDNDDAESEISLLMLNDKGINAKGLFLNLDRPRGSVPIASEIMTGQA